MDLVAFVERFWLVLWNDRSVDAMMADLDPAYVQHDHRPLQMSGSSREDWLEYMEGWWTLVPDARIVDVSVIAAEPQVVVYALRAQGTDAISGGPMELLMHLVNRFENGRICEAHIFENAAEASAHSASLSQP